MSFKEEFLRFIHIAAAKVYDNRSNIEFAASLVGTIGGSAWLAKKTYDISDCIKGYRAKKDEIQKSDLSEEDKKNELKSLSGSTVKVILKAYAAPTIVIAAAEACAVASKVTDRKEIAETNTALLGYVAGYEILKNWIVENEGSEKFREVAYGEKVNEVVDPETGEVTETTAFGNVIPGEFAYFFDESSSLYSEVPGANPTVVRSVLKTTKIRNRYEGYWLLKDVLKDLGFPKKVYMDERIAKVGNVYRNKDGSYNDVDFGIDGEHLSIATQRFNDNLEPVVLLTFNCVPNVYKLL